SRKIREHAPLDTELHRIVDRLQRVQRQNFYQPVADISHHGRHSHAYSMRIEVDRDDDRALTGNADDEIVEAMRDLAHWLYRQLEREWDYMNSDEVVDEGILANAYTFTESGRRFG